MTDDATSDLPAIVLDLPGFRVLAAAVYGGELEVLVETADTGVACPSCGRQAAGPACAPAACRLPGPVTGGSAFTSGAAALERHLAAVAGVVRYRTGEIGPDGVGEDHTVPVDRSDSPTGPGTSDAPVRPCAVTVILSGNSVPSGVGGGSEVSSDTTDQGR